jgi:hypothetical protein
VNEEEEEEGDEGEKKDERRLDGEEVCANSCGSGGRAPRKEATTASEPNANSKSKSPVQRREQVAGVRAWGRGGDGDGDSRIERLQGPRTGTEFAAALHRTASGGMAVHGKTQSINQPTSRPQHRVPGLRIPS